MYVHGCMSSSDMSTVMCDIYYHHPLYPLYPLPPPPPLPDNRHSNVVGY